MEFRADKSGMICGGKASIYIEVYLPSARALIFGGGHIALALSKYFDILKFPYVIADDRPEFASSERFPRADAVILLESYGNPLETIDISDNDFCVIVTQGHGGDKSVLEKLLTTPAAYIGMIGSSIKVKAVLDAVSASGLDTSDQRIHSPIGLDIGGESPEEIALAIAAEIQMVKNGKETALR